MPYNFYKNTVNDDTGEQFFPPKVEISAGPEDEFVEYFKNKSGTRLDVLSSKFYGDPTLYRVILLANPMYEREQDIPDGAVLRVPFPKGRVLKEYEQKIQIFKNL